MPPGHVCRRSVATTRQNGSCRPPATESRIPRRRVRRNNLAPRIWSKLRQAYRRPSMWFPILNKKNHGTQKTLSSNPQTTSSTRSRLPTIWGASSHLKKIQIFQSTRKYCKCSMVPEKYRSPQRLPNARHSR